MSRKQVIILTRKNKIVPNCICSQALGDRDEKENVSGIRGYENGRVYVAYQNAGVSNTS